jgi:hypothetical protein
MFYVQATLQAPKGIAARMKDADNRFPREAYVCWSRISKVAFLSIDDPPMPREEAEELLAQCAEIHNKHYNHNLRIVPA